ncbi:hypothetical protein AB1Y20_007188 [Prymnesium parvum]|uniref:Chromo domain-containing protein n=1 Tax=Prymnesium parvum TaxID=97485 RepID=A0AB34IWD5_PRYPA
MAEQKRVEAVVLMTRYSELLKLSCDDLKDQLKAWRLKLGVGASFAVTQANRTAYVLQVQALLAAEYGKAANDLEQGDAGTDGRGVLRKRNKDKPPGAAGRKRKARSDVVEYDGYEWAADEEFDLDAIVDKQVADGERIFANLGKVSKGILVYRLVFKGFPPDMEWWEPRSEVGKAALEEFEAALSREAAEKEAEESAEAELKQMETELCWVSDGESDADNDL